MTVTIPTRPAANPRMALNRYKGIKDLQMARSAVQPEKTTAAMIVIFRKLVERICFAATIPPNAKTILLMVSVMLTLPRPTPSSSEMGVKNRPETLVSMPREAADMPQTAIRTSKYLPLSSFM